MANAWCELLVEDLSGRCPPIRVGLPTDPEGKGTELLMVDVDTFLTTLYVIADDFCQSRRPKKRPGPEASLSESEVITLAIFARWSPVRQREGLLPLRRNQPARRLPHAANPPPVQPPVRSCTGLIEQIVLHLATLLGARECSLPGAR